MFGSLKNLYSTATIGDIKVPTITTIFLFVAVFFYIVLHKIL